MKTEYEVVYTTHNAYEETVREAFFSFLVLPCTDLSQSVKKVTFSNSLDADVFHHPNPFGFEVSNVRATRPFTEFDFCMRAIVEKTLMLLPFGNVLPIEEEIEQLTDYSFFLEHHLFLTTGHYTAIKESYHSKLLFKEPTQSVYAFLQQLNSFIHDLLEFDPEPTHVCTTANEVLDIGRGVCQDYTHLFIAIARLNKIPCRYVSGYLDQGLNLTGTAVMHAWAEAFIPGFGWQGFDPTNNLLADVHYIKASHGSDYADCSPIRGMLRTNGGHTTTYGVTIKPTKQGQMVQQQTL